MKNTAQTLVAIVGVTGIVGGFAGIASADSGVVGTLHGSGDHLYINDSTPGTPELVNWTNTFRTNDEDGGFDANWSYPVPSAWGGEIHASGPRFAPNASPGGTQVVNFEHMALGYLPSGTFFRFGDLDRQSFGEEFVLRAYTTAGDIIQDAWLDGIVGISGRGSGLGGTPVIGDMPSWSFINGEYSFVGNSTIGNPNFVINLVSNMGIGSLQVERPGNRSNSFSLAAPVPTPGAMSLLAVGGLLASRRRR